MSTKRQGTGGAFPVIPPFDPAWVPIEDVKVFGVTVIGSHAWMTQHENSDLDLFAIVAYPTTTVLRETPKYINRSLCRTTTEHGWPVDIHVHEVKHVVEQLCRGNINFLIGLASHLSMVMLPDIAELQRLVHKYPSRNVYKSIAGMVRNNMKKYGYNVESRNRKMIMHLEFGIRYLTTGVIVLRPPESEPTESEVKRLQIELDKAYQESDLPDSSCFEYREWLVNFRYKHMGGWARDSRPQA